MTRGTDCKSAVQIPHGLFCRSTFAAGRHVPSGGPPRRHGDPSRHRTRVSRRRALFDDLQPVPGLGKVRPQTQRGAVVFHRFGQTPLPQQQAGEVIVRLGVGRVEIERRAIVFLRLGRRRFL